MADEFDPFEGTSGLWDNADVAFKSCMFTYRTDLEKYPTGTVFYQIDAIVDGDDGPVEDEILYTIGSGWEPKDKGRYVAKESGKESGFNKQTGYFNLFSAAMEVGAPLRELAKSDFPKGPMDAKLMEGMVFRMVRTEVDYGEPIGKKQRLVPTEYKGRKGESAQAASDSGTKNGEVPTAMKAKLRKIAKDVKAAGGDFDEFVIQAYEVDGVSENPNAEDLVADDSENGIWAKA